MRASQSFVLFPFSLAIAGVLLFVLTNKRMYSNRACILTQTARMTGQKKRERMAKASNLAGFDLEPDYPLANSEATRMLADALDRAAKDKGLSQRQLAKILNYKTSVVLSHMALGRVPIPIDRALDFARLLGMDAPRFLMAVLEQRHPDIDFARVLGAPGKSKVSKSGRESYTLEELESIAGRELDELPVDRINVLREAVGDPNAARRWLDLSELPVIDKLRKTHPKGLTPTQRRALEQAIESL